MTHIRPLIAKILIQVGADEPKEIGTIEIPIQVQISENSPSATRSNLPATVLYSPAAEHIPNSSAAECPCEGCRECIDTFRPTLEQGTPPASYFKK